MASKKILQEKCVKLLYTYIYIFRPFPVGKSQSVVEQSLGAPQQSYTVGFLSILKTKD